MTVRVTFIRPGKGVSEYTERLVFDRPDVKVLLLDGSPHEAAFENDQIILGRDAPIVWYVFPEQWYEIGRFHETDGTFTGWYTNLCTPFEIVGREWRTTDLFLDFWQPVTGEAVWLDEDELRSAVASRLLDEDVRKRIRLEREAIARAHAAEDWPPSVAKDLDLATVRLAASNS